MSLKLRATGLGSGIDKDRPDLHGLHWRVGDRPHLRDPWRSRQSALVLVDDRQRPDDTGLFKRWRVTEPRSSHDPRTAAIFRGVRWRTHGVQNLPSGRSSQQARQARHLQRWTVRGTPQDGPVLRCAVQKGGGAAPRRTVQDGCHGKSTSISLSRGHPFAKIGGAYIEMRSLLCGGCHAKSSRRHRAGCTLAEYVALCMRLP